MTRQIVTLIGSMLLLTLVGCGGDGDGGGSPLPLGKEAVAEHTQIGAGGKTTGTTVGITVLKVTKGTQEELKQGGLEVDDPEEETATPYYVDVRYANKGSNTIKRELNVGMEDEDGNLISSTTIISFGGPPFAKCARAEAGAFAPGETYESCTLFLVPEGKEPAKVSFLPYNPEEETEFIYWAVS